MITIVVHDKQWFIDRIGKRIYRKSNICKCPTCLTVGEVGLIILGETHAIYLYDCQIEMNIIYYEK